MRVLARRTFPPSFVRDVTLRAYSSPRGKEMARRMTFRWLPFAETSAELMQLHVHEAICLGAIVGPLDAEIDEEIWKQSRALIDLVDREKLGDREIGWLASLWRGTDEPIPLWQSLARVLEPDMRLAAANVLGCRQVQLKKPEVAVILFQEVIDKAAAGSLPFRFAREQLRKLGSKP